MAYCVLNSIRASQFSVKWESLFSPEAWENWSLQSMWLGHRHEQQLLLGYLGHNSHALFHYALVNVLLFMISLGLSATSCITDIFARIRKKAAICQGLQNQVPTGPRQMLLISEQAWKIGSQRDCGKLGSTFPFQEGQPLPLSTWLPLLGMRTTCPDLLLYPESRNPDFHVSSLRCLKFMTKADILFKISFQVLLKILCANIVQN